MSYSVQDAKAEIDDLIYEALDSKDEVKLRQVASQLKDLGDDEEADRLIKIARKWNDEEQTIIRDNITFVNNYCCSNQENQKLIKHFNNLHSEENNKKLLVHLDTYDRELLKYLNDNHYSFSQTFLQQKQLYHRYF